MDSQDDNLEKRPAESIYSVFSMLGTTSRAYYSMIGFGLMFFKYFVEALLIDSLTNKFFDPISFVTPSLLVRDRFYSAAPEWLPWAIALWSVPFVWVAVAMSIRRANDAGWSPWSGLLVLIPLVNLPVMLLLAIIPAQDRSEFKKQVDVEELKGGRAVLLSSLLGTFVGGLFAFVITLVSVYSLDSYGSSLFIGMPLVSGAVASYVYNQPAMRGFGASLCVGMLSVAIGGLGLLLFAFEGVICLIMACPLIIPLGALGGVLGWGLAKTIVAKSKWMLGGAVLVVPFFTSVEQHLQTYQVEMVESSVVISAPPSVVWENVIAFPDIESTPAWYFRYGIASPLRARIVGSGVDAVRHCEFTTGDFVEPITVWDQPKRLAFDVSEQPDALVELTPYKNVRPPHLQHSFRSVRGEFELIDLENGSTRLIGRTWYRIDMGPRLYWRFWTDEIIHRIHLRVLNHIRDGIQE